MCGVCAGGKHLRRRQPACCELTICVELNSTLLHLMKTSAFRVNKALLNRDG